MRRVKDVISANKGNKIVFIALVSEGVLVAIFGLWNFYRGELWVSPAWSADLVQGLLVSVPLLVIFASLYANAERLAVFSQELARFKNEIVAPFAASLSWSQCALVSLLAAVGEELFFRGMLQQELGVTLSSVLFALLHVGPALRRLPLVALLYFGASAYLGMSYDLSHSITVPITAHFSYDLLMLCLIKKLDTKKLKQHRTE